MLGAGCASPGSNLTVYGNITNYRTTGAGSAIKSFMSTGKKEHEDSITHNSYAVLNFLDREQATAVAETSMQRTDRPTMPRESIETAQMRTMYCSILPRLASTLPELDKFSSRPDNGMMAWHS